MIKKEKWEKLKAWMAALGIDEADCQESFIIGSGRGGQKLQKTASCVRLKHAPSNIEIKCQKSRYRETNRYYARYLLCEKIDARVNQEQSQQQQAIEKIRRQKRKRSRRAQAKILANKQKRGELKQSRQKPDVNHDD